MLPRRRKYEPTQIFFPLFTDLLICLMTRFVDRQDDSGLEFGSCDKPVGISLSRGHYILRSIFNVRKSSARWLSHLLTDGQKNQRVKIAKQLLKIFPNYAKSNLQINLLAVKLGFIIFKLLGRLK